MKDLSAKQLKAIALLCEGRNQNSVAATMEINPETLRRWSLEPSYKQALAKARREVWHDAIGDAGVRITNALATLQNIFLDETMPPAVRVSAASKFIDCTKPPAELSEQDDSPQTDLPQVLIYLPDNGRGDSNNPRAPFPPEE